MSLINYSYFFFGVGNTFVVFTLILFSHKINIFIRPKHESVVLGYGKKKRERLFDCLTGSLSLVKMKVFIIGIWYVGLRRHILRWYSLQA